MKVLSLRLKNLNSLRGEFSLDFNREPFVDAGLFAVIGPTGAGKSTIFDALCISLYGETPRLQKRKAAGAGVLEIVSRHTAEAWAEVDFEVPRGRYRSRWEVHRARGSVAGAFQQPRMRLVRIDSAGEELIEDKLSEVPDRISRLTGLDFTRFTKSVLLAQGAFAAFLDAKPGERADLLEKMTGSFIYSELSRLAFERSKEEEQKGLEIARRIEDISVLNNESLAALHEQLAKAQERYSRAKMSRDALVLAAEKARRGQKLAAELEESAADLGKLEEQKTRIDSIREQLRRHHLVEPERNDIRQFDVLSSELSKISGGILELESVLDQINLAIASLESGTQEFRISLKESRNELSGLREKKGEAEKLEALQAERKARLSDEMERIQRVEGQIARSSEEIEQFSGRLSDLNSEKQKLETATGSSGLAELSQNRELFLTRINEWTSLEQEIQELMAELELLLKEQADLSQNTGEALFPESTALRKELAEIDEELTRSGGSGIIRNELSALEHQLGDLKALVPWTERREDLQHELLQVRRQIEELEAGIASARQKADTAAALREEAEAGFMQLAASRLKKELKSGRPCPVCGSKEHPGARQHELFDEELPEDTELGISSAEKQYRDVLVHLATLESSLDSRRENAQSLENEIADLNVRLEEKECSPAVLEDLDTKIHKLSVRLETVVSLEKKRDDLRSGLEELRNQEAAKQEELSRNQNRAAVVDERVRGIDESLRRKKESLLSHESWILQTAEKAGLSGDMSQLRDAAVSKTTEYRESCEKLESISAEERSLSEKLEQYALNLSERREEYKGLAEQCDELQSQLSEISGRLTELTGGQSFNELLQQREQKVLKIEEDFEAQQQKLNREKEQRAALQGKLETAQNLLEEKQREHETLGKDLDRRARAAGFSGIDDFREAFLDNAESLMETVEQWESSKKSLDQRQSELRRELDEIPQELRDSFAVEKQLAEADDEYNQAQKELFDYQSRIAVDRENRERRESLLKEQEAQREEYQIWWRLKGLIGSASGDVFRRFAQGLTLDYLVSLANRHLGRFSGRYRLQRDGGEELSLFIVDTWQADVVRPVETLSGGETFLASLSLALGLSELAGRKTRIDSLFLDEGFGSLDAETLETVLAALETLRSSGKLVGIISHVEALKERIPVQIRVRRKGTGYSTLSVSP